MISYCICVFRPRLFYILLEDLIRKTTTPYEILVWINTRAPELDGYINRLSYRGIPIKIVGSSTENVGMLGYKMLFKAAKYDMIAQVHDDVVCISKKISEKAQEIFSANPKIGQIVTDVIQDAFTTGGRPSDDAYSLFDSARGLFTGPVDGWFSIYHRSILQLLLDAPYERYFYLGSYIQMQLRARERDGVLCKAMKVFHLAGPAYAQLLETVQTEVRKYLSLGNKEAAELYSSLNVTPEMLDQMAKEYEKNVDLIESFKK